MFGALLKSITGNSQSDFSESQHQIFNWSLEVGSQDSHVFNNISKEEESHKFFVIDVKVLSVL